MPKAVSILPHEAKALLELFYLQPIVFGQRQNKSSSFACQFQVADDATQNALPFLCHKENVQCYGSSCKQGSLSENLQRANVCFSEHEYPTS